MKIIENVQRITTPETREHFFKIMSRIRTGALLVVPLAQA
jgi:hypothetical protein